MSTCLHPLHATPGVLCPGCGQAGPEVNYVPFSDGDGENGPCAPAVCCLKAHPCSAHGGPDEHLACTQPCGPGCTWSKGGVYTLRTPQRYKVHGQTVIARNVFQAYAMRFGVSLAQAIADRDIPMTEEDCRIEFFQAAGRQPTPEEMATMSPDPLQAVLDELGRD